MYGLNDLKWQKILLRALPMPLIFQEMKETEPGALCICLCDVMLHWICKDILCRQALGKDSWI